VPRIITYNVHRCLGTDGRLSPQRIAEVIAAYQPDVVALQELDVRRKRSGGIDQAHVIANALGMRLHFHPAIRVLDEEYGDAILSTKPSRLVKAGPLPGMNRRPWLEPRGALWASVDFGRYELQVINTHLGLRRRERRAQVEELLGPQWLGHEMCREPVLLLGDFNTLPRSRSYNLLSRRLSDAHAVARVAQRTGPTFPSWAPILRIDYVFASSTISIGRAETIRTGLARLASDHLPLLVDFEVSG
jgi:endonuclease/exonuclease/phosphatase family metal-dependent hydrolase